MKRICQNPHCKKEFEAKAADVKRGWARCCCKSCASWKREKAKGNHGQLFDKNGARITPTYQSELDRMHEAGMDCQEMSERGY